MTGRLGGLDAARAVAILGMFVIHFNRSGGSGGGDTVTNGFVAGPAAVSVLFVLVSGIALRLQTARGSSALPVVRRRLLVRAAVFVPLGLGLQNLDPDGVSVILQVFAVLYLVAVPLAGRPDRTLLVVGAVASIVGAVVHVAWEAADPGFVDGAAVAFGDPVGDVVAAVLLTGPYPAVVFVGPFVLGMWLGGRDLGAVPVQLRLVAAGAVAGVGLSLVGLIADANVDAASSDLARLHADITIDAKSPLWLANGLGWSVAILATCLLVVPRLGALVRPVVAAGQVSLTLYVAHLAVIAVDPDAVRTASVSGAVARALVAFAVGAVLAVAWLARWRRGPLESALAGIEDAVPTPDGRYGPPS